MKDVGVVAMMVAVGLAGCTGGSDDASGASGADAGDELPTLPEGLEMDGGEVVTYTDTTVVWQWNSALRPGYCCEVPDQVASRAETTFDVPNGVPIAIQAVADSPRGPDDMLSLRVADASGAVFCADTQGFPPEISGPSAACTDYTLDPASDGPWTVRVDSVINPHQEIPFTLNVTLTTGAKAGKAVAAQQTPAPGSPGPGVVIGFDDTGMNPYHEAFRDHSPVAYRHPSTYLDGYPADAKALELTLEAPTYVEALAADAETWDKVEAGTLYWIPGTRIIAAIMPDDAVAEAWGDEYFCQPILDCYFHGTAVASRAVAQETGLCQKCRIAVTQGFPAGLEWLGEQPWVDLISISWHDSDGIVGQRAEDAALAAKKPVFYMSGNGFAPEEVGPGTPATTWPHQGAPQAITVGGHDNGRVNLWPSTMPHVVADACPDVADHRAKHGFYLACGVSHSAPYVAGAGAELVLEARRILSDNAAGTDDTTLAEGTPGDVTGGPLADGEFTADELKRLLFTTADPRPPEGDQDGRWCDLTDHPVSCTTFPTTPVEWQTIPDDVPAYYFIGYGAVNEDTLERAKRVLRGEEPMPERPVEDAFFALDQEVRKALVEVDL